MNLDKETIKERSDLLLYAKNNLRPSKRAGRNMFICPFCGSGDGRNKTGAFSITPDGSAFKCFSCGKTGDIFSLIGQVENIASFSDQLNRAAELCGIDPGGQDPATMRPKEAKTEQKQPSQESQEPAEEYKKAVSFYLGQCINNINTPGNKGKSYLHGRGFNEITIERYKLGYDPNFKNSGAGYIIIPYPETCYYIARRADNNPDYKHIKPKREEAGAEPVFNLSAIYSDPEKPAFICEAPLDALSIIQAGGQALAIGGTGREKFLNQIQTRKPESLLILCFDEDEPGQETAQGLAQELDALKIPYRRAQFIKQYNQENGESMKDANELLKTAPEAFYKGVRAEIDKETRDYIQEHNGAAILEDFKAWIKEHANTEATPTGFKELDKQLDGGLYEGLYIIGALSSMGKTTFILQLADQIAESGQAVLYFSLEMSKNELIAKSLSRNTYKIAPGEGLTTRGILNYKLYAQYSQAQKDSIKKAVERYKKSGSNLYFYEGLGNIGAAEIREAVEQFKKRFSSAPVVIIDYLQILAPYNEKYSDKQNTDKSVLELKRLSRDYKIPVIGISSFNRDSYKDGAGMSAFKESGAIEYGADILLALQPQKLEDQSDKKRAVDDHKTKTERPIEAVILKNRNGITGGKINFIYYPEYNYFKETDQATRPQQSGNIIY